MVKVEKVVLVHHSAAQMFNLVDDVERYQEFLPWCGGVDLIERSDASTTATVHINFHRLKQQFTTRNKKRFPDAMDIEFKAGPFKHFEGHWRFIALSDEACKIEFKLSYEFSNVFLSQLISPVFSHIANTFVDSFVARADNILNK
jgi:ribosome-associated toxin RatA of RatAB toxin-antitoxin module